LEQSTIRATGSRKNAVAQVRIKPGNGKIEINGKEPLKYLCRQNLITLAFAPLEEVKLTGRFDIIIKANGGGLTGQAGAMRMAMARALIKYDPELRGALKDCGFLTRDARMVERKKYGQAKARKRFQFSKR
jgi:small subunit ribosomal protein S9